MDNIQLKELFDSIIALPNAFDRVLKLKQIKKEYKKSSFYKQTRMPIQMAYKWFVQDFISNTIIHASKFTDASYVGEYATNLLDNISPDAIEDFVDRIVNSLNTSEMLAASAEIGEELKKLQR